VNVFDLAGRLGLPKPVVRDGMLTINGGYLPLRLRPASRRVLAADTLLWLNSGTRVSGRTWYVSAADASHTLNALLCPVEFASPSPDSPIVIDPGHGGADDGATGTRLRLREKDATLDIARRVRTLLQDKGYPVRLTRTSDATLGLPQRVACAKSCRASLFLSIHLNSAHNRTSAGIETYIVPDAGFPGTGEGSRSDVACLGNTHPKQNTFLAFSLQSKLTSALPAAIDRGVRRARYVVLRDAPCPAALVECGFLSNPAEEQKLSTPKHRARLAAAIAEAIHSLPWQSNATAATAAEELHIAPSQPRHR
jgi:N-acetylmuramoyl-L-alanine amidase